MNCCWIILLLMFSGRGGFCNNGCAAETNNGCGRERRGRERGNDCGCREQENDCGCNERENDRERRGSDCGRAEENRERECCDIPTMIPQPWQEYARRDADDCEK